MAPRMAQNLPRPFSRCGHGWKCPYFVSNSTQASRAMLRLELCKEGPPTARDAKEVGAAYLKKTNSSIRPWGKRFLHK